MDGTTYETLIREARTMKEAGKKPTHYYIGTGGFSERRGYIVKRVSRAPVKDSDILYMVTFCGDVAHVWTGYESCFVQDKPGILAFYDRGFSR